MKTSDEAAKLTKEAKRAKIAVFAYSEPGYACLEELLETGANVSVVFTHEDDPNEEIWFRSVADLALARGVPLRTDSRIGPDAVNFLRGKGVELILSVYYRALIPGEVLAIPRLGAYNIHGALLPRYRGRACVNWAVLNGETQTGATLHVMTASADRGDIVDQEPVPIAYEDTALDVFKKVSGASRLVLSRSLPSIEAGNPRKTPQDESRATKFGRRRPEDGRIDWNKTAEQVYNQVRALTHPFPGAFTDADGKKLFIWRARVSGGRSGQTPGGIVSRRPFLIAAADGDVELLSWRFEGEEERGVTAE
ncbi:MAG: formyltransferase [Synergistaceae bacterium]|nr:formyltransferase [Synergistaceae bacterium]